MSKNTLDEQAGLLGKIGKYLIYFYIVLFTVVYVFVLFSGINLELPDYLISLLVVGYILSFVFLIVSAVLGFRVEYQKSKKE